MKKIIFTGAATALITPFRDGELDFESFGRIIDAQVAGGISGLIVSGTTGECATLTDEEKIALYGYAVRRAEGRVPIIAGTGSNSTAHAVTLSRAAEKVGCSALLVVTPYYNKASADGLYEHYSRISDSVRLPIIAYNVPSRTGVDLPISTLKRLTNSGAICAIKEASGNLSKILKIADSCSDLTIYSGNDDQIIPIMSLGGKGVISVLSNLLPKETEELCATYLSGDTQRAKDLQVKYAELISLLFADVNPIPVKYVMAKMGLCRPEYRLPLTPPSSDLRQRLDEISKRLIGLF